MTKKSNQLHTFCKGSFTAACGIQFAAVEIRWKHCRHCSTRIVHLIQLRVCLVPEDLTLLNAEPYVVAGA